MAQKIKIQNEHVLFDIDHVKLPNRIDDYAMTAGGYPYDKKLKRSKYEDQLYRLQIELVKMQAWLRKTDERIIMLFEGRDAAGKGGSIKTIAAYLNPRHAKIVALNKPTKVEQGQFYFQRYMKHFPSNGHMTLFDRSWYNRPGIERVMGFCTEEQVEKFFEQVTDFEKMIVEEGYSFHKFWLTIGRETQLERFHARRHDPLKQWKLSPIDIASVTKWDDYTKAKMEMLTRTHTNHAPWTVVRYNDKRRGRLNLIQHILLNVDYENRDLEAIGEIDPQILDAQGNFFELS